MARIRAAFLVLAIALLAACSGGGPTLEGPGAAEGDPTADSGGEGESGEGGDDAGGGEGGSIRFLHWRGEDSAVFEELIAAFTEETGITVETNVLPSNQYEEQAQASITGTGGADVFATFPGNQFAALAPTGVYADLTDAEFADRFEERFLEAGNIEGRQLAYPLQLVFNIPVYNVGLFNEELGLEPPPDWEGFLQLCEDLKAADVTPILFAGDVSPSQFINPMMMNNMPDEDIWQRVEAGEARVDEEWMIKTLSQIAELQANGCFQEDPLGARNETLAATFAQGEAGMLATGSYAMAQIDAIAPDLEMGLLAPITVSEDEAWEGIRTTTFMLGVNAESENQEAAASFIEFLTRPENATTYANGTGQLLTLTDVEYETEELQAQTEWIDRETRFQPRFKITKGEINTGLITAVEDVLSGVPPEEAAATFQATVDRAIAGG